MLFEINEPAILIGSIVLLVLATEAGFRLGRRRHAHTSEPVKSHIGAMEGAILGLLALLLGFSFSLSSARYDARKQLVVGESNAIGTAYLRVQLLPEPQKAALLKLFPAYVDTRIQFLDAGNDAEQLREVDRRTGELQAQIWALAVAASAADTHSVATSLFVQALNDMIDMTAKRSAAMRNRVPESVLLLLYLVATIAMGFIGYGFGLSGERSQLPVLTLALLISAVILIIIDFDRPRRGIIIVNQQSMIELRQSLQSTP